MAFFARQIVIGAHGQFTVEAWIERRLRHLVLLLGGLHISLRRFEVRVIAHHVPACRLQIGRQLALDRDRCFQLIGHAADGTVEVGLGVRQVDLSGVEVVLGQCTTSAGLVGVCSAADTLLAAQADLVVDAQVSLQVVLGQCDEFALLEHFQVDLGGTQGKIFGAALHIVGAGVGHRLGTSYFVTGVEPVKQHLAQAQFGLGVVQSLGVVAAQRAGGRVVRALAPVAAHQIDHRQVTGIGRYAVLVARQTIVNVRLQVRVKVDSGLYRFMKAHRLNVGAHHR